MRDSKFGRALVLETFSKAGGYILGFRVDPQDRIGEVYQEAKSLFTVYAEAPLFGVDFSVEAETPSIDALLQSKVQEDLELADEQEDAHAIAAYYAATSAVEDESRFDSVVFDPRLGLAVEGLVDGLTLEQLWRVM